MIHIRVVFRWFHRAVSPEHINILASECPLSPNLKVKLVRCDYLRLGLSTYSSRHLGIRVLSIYWPRALNVYAWWKTLWAALGHVNGASEDVLCRSYLALVRDNSFPAIKTCLIQVHQFKVYILILKNKRLKNMWHPSTCRWCRPIVYGFI